MRSRKKPARRGTNARQPDRKDDAPGTIGSPATSQPPRAADPPPAEYEEPGARGPDRQRVQGMSIDPKLEDDTTPPPPRRG
jgi:hypothetical protein